MIYTNKTENSTITYFTQLLQAPVDRSFGFRLSPRGDGYSVTQQAIFNCKLSEWSPPFGGGELNLLTITSEHLRNLTYIMIHQFLFGKAPLFRQFVLFDKMILSYLLRCDIMLLFGAIYFLCILLCRRQLKSQGKGLIFLYAQKKNFVRVQNIFPT